MLALAHASQYGLWIGAWWLLGRAALQGRLDAAWLAAWALALLTLVPLQLAALWLQGRVAITVGALLKQRLLTGAFGLEPEEIRREGAGHLLGRVIEAEAVESLALGGGFMALLAALELVIAAGVLAIAVAASGHAARPLDGNRRRARLGFLPSPPGVGATPHRPDARSDRSDDRPSHAHRAAAADRWHGARMRRSNATCTPRPSWIARRCRCWRSSLAGGSSSACAAWRRLFVSERVERVGDGARDRPWRNPARVQSLSPLDGWSLEPRGRGDRVAADGAGLSRRDATAIGTGRASVDSSSSTTVHGARRDGPAIHARRTQSACASRLHALADGRRAGDTPGPVRLRKIHAGVAARRAAHAAVGSAPPGWPRPAHARTRRLATARRARAAVS